MMNHQVLKDLFKIKLEILKTGTELMPDPIKEKAQEFHKELLEVIHEVTGEYLKDQPAKQTQANKLQKVDIQ